MYIRAQTARWPECRLADLTNFNMSVMINNLNSIDCRLYLQLLCAVDSEQAPPRIQTSKAISVATAVCSLHRTSPIVRSYKPHRYLTPLRPYARNFRRQSYSRRIQTLHSLWTKPTLTPSLWPLPSLSFYLFLSHNIFISIIFFIVSLWTRYNRFLILHCGSCGLVA